jgi:hypothetical protein
MKWMFSLLFIMSLSPLSQGDDSCNPVTTVFNRGRHRIVSQFFQGDSPLFQGHDQTRRVIVFVDSPKANKNVSAFKTELCQRGFYVASFKVKGKKVTQAEYIAAGNFVIGKVKETLPGFRLAIYGWGKQAGVVVSLAKSHREDFYRVFLESPILNDRDKMDLAYSGIHGAKVFGCATDPHFSSAEFKTIHKRVPIYKNNIGRCSPHLVSSPEVVDTFIDTIEGNAATGFIPSFWTRI